MVITEVIQHYTEMTYLSPLEGMKLFILARVFEAFQSSLHVHVTNIFYARPILYVPRFLNPFRSTICSAFCQIYNF